MIQQINNLTRKLAGVFLAFTLLVCLINSSLAQVPTWSVDPTTYEYSMTVTATLDIQGSASGDPNDLIAAFVGNEVRGVANPDVFVNSTGQYLAFIHVYAHTSGEPITFKYYDHSADTEYSAVNTPIAFVIDGIIGSTSVPIRISYNHWPSNISLGSSVITENQPAASFVGTLQAEDADANESFTYTFATGDGDAGNTFFAINGSNLETTTSFDFESQNAHSIRLKVTDSQGGSYEKSLTIAVSNANDAPTGVSLSNSAVDENEVQGVVVALISAEDQDTQDAHTFELVAGSGDDNNDHFLITDNELILAKPLDFEEDAQLELRIKTTDSFGASHEEQLLVDINDLQETPEVQDATFEIAEHSETGTSIGFVQVKNANAGVPLVFEFADENSNAAISINQSTGEITVKDAALLDYEANTRIEFEVNVTDNELLNDNASVTIQLLDVIDNVLPINNYVSPNGDGLNDFLVIQNIQLYSGYELFVYDRNGLEVFQMAEYDNSWNGQSTNGKALPTGTYFYRFVKPDAVFQYKGQIAVVR